jgi:hypothetical protein
MGRMRRRCPRRLCCRSKLYRDVIVEMVVVVTLANLLLSVLQVLVGAFDHGVLDHVWWWWWRGTIDRVIVND